MNSIVVLNSPDVNVKMVAPACVRAKSVNPAIPFLLVATVVAPLRPCVDDATLTSTPETAMTLALESSRCKTGC